MAVPNWPGRFAPAGQAGLPPSLPVDARQYRRPGWSRPRPPRFCDQPATAPNSAARLPPEAPAMRCLRLASAGRLRRYVIRRERLLQHIRDVLGVAVLQVIDVPTAEGLPPRAVDQGIDPPRLFDVALGGETTRTALMRDIGMTRTRPANAPPLWP